MTKPKSVLVEAGADRVELRVPVDGRMRMIPLDPTSALALGHAIANAAIDVLSVPPGVPRVKSVRLKPFNVGGDALLEFSIDDGTPLSLIIDQNWLRALAAAAATALEHAETGGTS